MMPPTPQPLTNIGLTDLEIVRLNGAIRVLAASPKAFRDDPSLSCTLAGIGAKLDAALGEPAQPVYVADALEVRIAWCEGWHVIVDGERVGSFASRGAAERCAQAFGREGVQ